jgi:rfaE bifunctional protein kinase chain/domain
VLSSLTEKYQHKIKTAEELMRVIGPRPRARKVIMCHGVFDVVHPGHLRHLLYAKSKADVLVTSITADIHISKGHNRPHVPQELRALNLAAFEIVDYVVIDRNPTPIKNIALLQPDFFAKGYEYTSDGLPPKTQEEVVALQAYGGEVIFTPGDIVYSSTKLIDLAPPSIKNEKLLTVMDSEGLTFGSLRSALEKLGRFRVHVLGDTIVDSHTQTAMLGGQTKTPTISVLYERRDDYIGGAAVVAEHLRAAGATVVFSTVLGNDSLKDFVLDGLRKRGVECRAVIDQTRPTSSKNAIVAGGYRLLKVDTLDNRSISDEILQRLTAAIREAPCDAIVFSDFRHGIFNRRTIPGLVAAIPSGAFKVADSQVASRWGNILEFEGFDLITPNEREARFALGDQDSVVRPLALELHRRSKCKTVILKCGDRGIITYRSDSPTDFRAFFTVETFADRVIDAVGAGDALLAYATLAMIASKNDVIASILGNMAAGIECEHDGNVPVTPEQVLKKIDRVEKHVHFE